MFLRVKNTEKFKTMLADGEIKDCSIAFLEDTNQIWTQGKYYSTIPDGTKTNEVLTIKDDGTSEWKNIASVIPGCEDLIAYGVSWNTNQKDPDLTRIGNTTYHKTQPIPSAYRGCITQGKNIQYYLDESDWRWRESSNAKNYILKDQKLVVTDGVYTLTNEVFKTFQYERQWVKINDVACEARSIDTDTYTATLLPESEIAAGTYDVQLGSCRNGYDGEVCIDTSNEFWIKSIDGDTQKKVYLSPNYIDDTWEHQPRMLISAYQTVNLLWVPSNMGYLSTMPKNSCISICNYNTYARGGEWGGAYGRGEQNDIYLDKDPFRCNLGHPYTGQNLESMRSIYRSDGLGKEAVSYSQYKNIIVWPMFIEYATFQLGKDYNPELTSEGYKQGGLGKGISGIASNVSTKAIRNTNGALCPVDYTDTLGNGTGVITLPNITFPTTDYSGATTETIYNEGDANTITYKGLQAFRWHGFQNVFGDSHFSSFFEGISQEADIMYITPDDPSKYWTTSGEHNEDDRQVNIMTSTGSFGIKEFNLGTHADILPSDHCSATEGQYKNTSCWAHTGWKNNGASFGSGQNATIYTPLSMYCGPQNGHDNSGSCYRYVIYMD